MVEQTGSTTNSHFWKHTAGGCACVRKKESSLVFCCAEHEGAGIQNASVWSGCLNSEWSYIHRSTEYTDTHTQSGLRHFFSHFLSHTQNTHFSYILWHRTKSKQVTKCNYVLLYLWIDLLLHTMILDCLITAGYEYVYLLYVWAPDYKCKQLATTWNMTFKALQEALTQMMPTSSLNARKWSVHELWMLHYACMKSTKGNSISQCSSHFRIILHNGL